MKRYVMEFVRRGLSSCGFGPIVLAALYLILQHNGVVEVLTVRQVCTGILSVSVLAFVAGGLNAVYQMERLPLMVAILIHGGVLYLCYLATYLLNDWLEWGVMPVLVFSGIFVVGYFLIWAVIYGIIRSKTRRVNALLREKQQKDCG